MYDSDYYFAPFVFCVSFLGCLVCYMLWRCLHYTYSQFSASSATMIPRTNQNVVEYVIVVNPDDAIKLGVSYIR